MPHGPTPTKSTAPNPRTDMTDHDQTATLEELLGRATPLDAQAAAAADPYEIYEPEQLMHSIGVHKPVAPCRPTSPLTAMDEAGDGLHRCRPAIYCM